jgi:uncharacterized protein YrzB (UPF0473 family)
MDNNVVTLPLFDEEGNEVEFEVITKLDIEDKEYVIVVPKDEDVDEAVCLRIDVDDNGEEVLVPVENDEEFEKVSEAYEAFFNEDELN